MLEYFPFRLIVSPWCSFILVPLNKPVKKFLAFYVNWILIATKKVICVHEEIKNKLNSGNPYQRSAQSILSTRLLSRNIKIKLHESIVFSVVIMYVKLGLSHNRRTQAKALREQGAKEDSWV